MIAIVCATFAETSGILSDMKITKQITDTMPFLFEGKIRDLNVVLVLTGIGKENVLAAIKVLTQSYRIDALLSVGVAGAVNPILEIGDIVLGRQVSSLSNQNNEFASNSQLLDSAMGACKTLNKRFFIGNIITVPQIILSKEKKSEIYQKYGPFAVEMETYYIASEAAKCGIPFLSIRAISDKAKQSIELNFEKIKRGKLQKSLYFLVHPSAYFKFRKLNRDVIKAASNLMPVVATILSNFNQ